MNSEDTPLNNMRGWPPSLVGIADLIGITASLKLVEAYGGTQVYVSKAPKPEHKLSQVIGLDAAQKLSALMGGTPLAVANLKSIRTKKELIAQAEGSVREIALRFGVTERWTRMCRQGGAASMKAPSK